jgi:hypothetical protein
MEEGRLPKEVMKRRPLGRRKRETPKLTWAEGIGGGRVELQTQLEKEDNMISKWAQEDVNTLYSLLHNNNQISLSEVQEFFAKDVEET